MKVQNVDEKVLKLSTKINHQQRVQFSFRNLNRLADGIGSKFGRIIYSFSSFITGYVLGFYYLWKLALVMLPILPPLAVSAGIMAKVNYAPEKDLSQTRDPTY